MGSSRSCRTRGPGLRCRTDRSDRSPELCYLVPMEQAIRPHRGGTVLAVGILSLVAAFFLIPLGVVAWIMGSRDLKGMKRSEVEPAGRSLTRIGWVFGIASSVLWLG